MFLDFSRLGHDDVLFEILDCIKVIHILFFYHAAMTLVWVVKFNLPSQNVVIINYWGNNFFLFSTEPRLVEMVSFLTNTIIIW